MQEWKQVKISSVFNMLIRMFLKESRQNCQQAAEHTNLGLSKRSEALEIQVWRQKHAGESPRDENGSMCASGESCRFSMGP